MCTCTCSRQRYLWNTCKKLGITISEPRRLCMSSWNDVSSSSIGLSGLPVELLRQLRECLPSPTAASGLAFAHSCTSSSRISSGTGCGLPFFLPSKHALPGLNIVHKLSLLASMKRESEKAGLRQGNAVGKSLSLQNDPQLWTLRWRGRSVGADALFERTLRWSGRLLRADARSAQTLMTNY